LVTLLALAVIVAQDMSASSLAGSVVDAATLRPLQGAMVTLYAAPSGLLRGNTGNGSGLVQQRSTTTDLSGNYQFTGIGAGDYRIHVQALAYRTTSINVRVSGRDAAQLSIGLHVDPIALQPVEANARGASNAPMTAARFDSELRLDLERARQQQFAASDVRVVTAFDIAESVSLAEPDVFRAFQRLPGVSTRDDFTTELWTRGAPMDQTAIYFDGVPLFNPLHASGAFSAINPDAIGAAFFHPGVQPTELGTAGAGVIDLRTRRGTTRTQGAAELSIISGKLTLMGGSADGGASWVVAGRRTHIDMLTNEPYNFSDLTMRWDVTLSPEWRLEASGLIEADRLKGDVANIVTATNASWGNRAGRITAAKRIARGEMRHTLGWSGFAASSIPTEERPVFGNPDVPYYPMFGEYRGQLVDNAMQYATIGTTWESVNEAGNTQATSGVRIVSQQARYETQGLWPQTSSSTPLYSADELLYLTAWTDRSWRITPKLDADAGMRVEVSQSGLHAAPRLAVRARMSDATSVSFAGGRTYQHAQSITPVGLGNDVVAMSNLFWVLSGDSVPVLRSTIGTIGLEHWLTRSILFSATLYDRSVHGMIVPEPGPQWLMDRPLFTDASNRAHGADITLRKLGGRMTTAVSYSYSDSEIQVGAVRYNSPWSRRHSFDATTTISANENLRLGAAFTAASGAAFTRYDGALRNCRTANPRDCTFMLYAREPGAERSPGYTSLDVMVDWRGKFGRLDWGAYAQIQNALGNRNAAAYEWSRLTCECGSTDGEPPIVNPDPTRKLPANNEFLQGLPMLPMVGLRVAF
jgi:hypothetical protein